MISISLKSKVPCFFLKQFHQTPIRLSSTGIIFKKSSALFDNLNSSGIQVQTTNNLSRKKSNFEKWQENPNANPFETPLNKIANYVANFDVKQAIKHYKHRDFLKEIFPVLQFLHECSFTDISLSYYFKNFPE